MKRDYLPEHFKIKVGDTYKNDFGVVKVISQIDENNFEIAHITKPYNVFKNFIVSGNGRFGDCWNNPKSLCYK